MSHVLAIEKICSILRSHYVRKLKFMLPMLNLLEVGSLKEKLEIIDGKTDQSGSSSVSYNLILEVRMRYRVVVNYH